MYVMQHLTSSRGMVRCMLCNTSHHVFWIDYVEYDILNAELALSKCSEYDANKDLIFLLSTDK